MTTGSDRADGSRERIPPPRESGGWSATLASAASGPASLRVTGSYVLFRPPDVGVELRRHDPQAADPGELTLDRILRQESPDPGNPITIGNPMPKTIRVPVSYEEQISPDVNVVIIQPEGVRIAVTKAEPPDQVDPAP